MKCTVKNLYNQIVKKPMRELNSTLLKLPHQDMRQLTVYTVWSPVHRCIVLAIPDEIQQQAQEDLDDNCSVTK